jgi:hypothetical protein
VENLHLTPVDENGVPISILEGIESSEARHMLDLDMTRPVFFDTPSCVVCMEFHDPELTDNICADNLPVYCNPEKGYALWYMGLKPVKDLLMNHIPGGVLMWISGKERARVRAAGKVPFPPDFGFDWLNKRAIPYLTASELMSKVAIFGEHKIALNLKRQ